MAYKDRFNKHHDNNATEAITTSDATSEETLVIEAENNAEEVIDDATVLDVQPVEEKKEEPKMEEKKEEVIVNNTPDNKAEIEELNNKIKAWEADLKRSRNNTVNATIYDNIKKAKKKIRDLSSQLPPSKIIYDNNSPHTIGNRQKMRKKLESIDDHIVRII